MIDWTRARHEELEFQRLSPGGAFLGVIEGVSGGTINDNLNTALKTSGTLNIIGDGDLDDDWVRIIIHVTQDGATEDVVIGTFLVATPTRSRYDAVTEATVNLYSTLLVLQDDRLKSTLVVPAVTDILEYVRAIVVAAGLRCVVTTGASAPMTTIAAVFDVGTSRLDVINHLLTVAGYSSASTDALGAVVVRPYTATGSRPVAWTFRDGDDSIFTPPFDDTLDWYSTPNVVVVTPSSPSGSALVPAIARNDNPTSRYSIVSRRGREIVRSETVSDANDQAALQVKADALLESSTSLMNTGTIRHTWAPFEMGDVIRLDYRAQGIDYRMIAQSRDTVLAPGLPSTTTLRRFIDG